MGDIIFNGCQPTFNLHYAGNKKLFDNFQSLLFQTISKYFIHTRNVRKSYTVHIEEPHLLLLRCMENSKGLLNPIFDSRGLTWKVRLFTYIFYNVDYAIFSLISRVLKETFVTLQFFSESPCLCMLNPFFLIYVMKPSLHPLAVIST